MSTVQAFSVQNPEHDFNKIPQRNITNDVELPLQDLEDVSSGMRDQCQTLLIPYECEESDINELRKQKENAKKELKQLRMDNSNLNQAIGLCQMRILSLRPMPQVPDCDIISQCEHLCQTVSQWVEGEMGRVIRKVGYEVELITDGGSLYMRDVLDLIPVAGEFLVSSIMHTHIQQRFFGKDVILFGLLEPIKSLVYEAGTSMANLKPERGRSAESEIYFKDLTELIMSRYHDHQYMALGIPESYRQHTFHSKNKIVRSRIVYQPSFLSRLRNIPCAPA